MYHLISIQASINVLARLMSSEHLRKSSDIIIAIQKTLAPQEKNVTPINLKRLAGITLALNMLIISEFTSTSFSQQVKVQLLWLYVLLFV